MKVKLEVFAKASVVSTITWIIAFLFLLLLSLSGRHSLSMEDYTLFSFMSALIAIAMGWFAYDHILDERTIPFKKGDCVVENDKVSGITENAIYWKNDPAIYAKRIIRAVEFEIYPHHISLSPITDNPKVRNIGYIVNTATIDHQEFYERFLKNADSESPGDFIGRNCYEFNEKYSGELGKLYNPLDKSQQENFSRMITTFLAPILDAEGAGIIIKEARFWTE